MGLFSGSRKPKRASSTSQPKEKERRRQSSAPPRTRQPSSHNAPPPPLPWSAQHHSPPFQPAGYLPAPPGWSPSPQGQQHQHQQLQQQSQQPPPHYQYHRPYPPIVVNQYYLSPPSSNASSASSNAGNALCRLTGSAVNLVNDVLPGSLQVSPQLFDDGLPAWHAYGTQLLNQSAALYDQISSRFNDIMTSIDQNKFLGNEKELFTYQPQPSSSNAVVAPAHTHKRPQSPKKGKKEKQATIVASSVASGGYFAKVELYSNARLPLDLPPLRLYIPTYPLLCLAAQYSDRVYEKPRGSERDAHVDADWKTGAKAMVIKSVPMDHMNTIVFAIRGTATFMDWAVNLNMAPTSPQGFLDDASNFCHAGFLSVARRMIKPVAARLRQLLEENPSRATYSLLITGHSAGGAVAALLYSHMLSTSAEAQSELTALTGAFRRIHCITFGTPPVSLVPLKKPDRPELKKWLFMSFVNEGDPVARADKGYVKSLLELLAAPAPGNTSTLTGATSKSDGKSDSKSDSRSDSKKSKSSSSSKSSSKSKTQSPKKRSSKESTRDRSKDRSKESPPMWNVPRCTLSSAGRIIVLRSGDPTSRIKTKKTVEERLDEGVIAQVATDEDLRGVIWGDPVCHVMRLYKGRIDTLAVGAVTAAGH